jgi:hypothetical protein
MAWHLTNACNPCVVPRRVGGSAPRVRGIAWNDAPPAADQKLGVPLPGLGALRCRLSRLDPWQVRPPEAVGGRS